MDKIEISTIFAEFTSGSTSSVDRNDGEIWSKLSYALPIIIILFIIIVILSLIVGYILYTKRKTMVALRSVVNYNIEESTRFSSDMDFTNTDNFTVSIQTPIS